jgi:GH24 family phage-related lysozyme (muramidase)
MIKPNRKVALVASAIAIAAPAEGLRQTVYYDPPGIPTVCFGHTGPDVDPNKTYTLGECRALLDKDMSSALDDVERCQPGLPDSVLVAFGDAVFNLGPKIVCNRSASTAARLLDADRYADACRQLPRWNKARIAGITVELPGLTKRRIIERDYCLSGLPDV